MKVEIRLESGLPKPYAVICAAAVDNEVRRAAEFLQNGSDPVITAREDEKTAVVRPEEIFMARVEDRKTMLYFGKARAVCPKRLSELESLLGRDFLRISKFTLISLKQLKEVEPSWNGSMYAVLKNGCRDTISRKYLPALKKYLGL